MFRKGCAAVTLYSPWDGIVGSQASLQLLSDTRSCLQYENTIQKCLKHTQYINLIKIRNVLRTPEARRKITNEFYLYEKIEQTPLFLTKLEDHFKF